jgi:hypothetical protein
MSKAPNPRTGRLVLLVWILIAVFYFRISYDYIRVSMSDEKFTQYLQYIVQIAGAENRPAGEVRNFLLVKSEELGLPIRGDQIVIKGGGTTLGVSVVYDIDIEIPILDRGIYHRQYDHKAYYKSPN